MDRATRWTVGLVGLAFAAGYGLADRIGGQRPAEAAAQAPARAADVPRSGEPPSATAARPAAHAARPERWASDDPPTSPGWYPPPAQAYYGGWQPPAPEPYRPSAAPGWEEASGAFWWGPDEMGEGPPPPTAGWAAPAVPREPFVPWPAAAGSPRREVGALAGSPVHWGPAPPASPGLPHDAPPAEGDAGRSPGATLPAAEAAGPVPQADGPGAVATWLPDPWSAAPPAGEGPGRTESGAAEGLPLARVEPGGWDAQAPAVAVPAGPVAAAGMGAGRSLATEEHSGVAGVLPEETGAPVAEGAAPAGAAGHGGEWLSPNVLLPGREPGELPTEAGGT